MSVRLGGAARTLPPRSAAGSRSSTSRPSSAAAGEELTRWVDLVERVTFRVGDPLGLPYDDANFDVVWTQHSSMNIPDKRRHYTEAHRVLAPGGRLAIHEITGGRDIGAVDFPMPWASRPVLSSLSPEDEGVRTNGAGIAASTEQLGGWT